MHPTPEPTTLTRARVEWREDGTAVSPDYGDIFHATAGALAQTRHVFIAGNALAERWQAGQNPVIGELGFGSGLNFLATVAAFLEQAPAQATLHYLSIEKQPWTQADTRRLLAAALPAELVAAWCEALDWLCVGANRIELLGGRVQLTLVLGDAETVLPQLQAGVDAWYLDGFNPAKNAAMWSAAVFRQLARLSRPDATLATWCCAGAVRRELSAAGFELQKAPGFAGKREMLRGRYAADTRAQPAPPEVVTIAGAGLAGAWLARTLAERGVRVELHDAAAAPAAGASGMPLLMVRPFARHRDTPMARLLWQAAYHACRRYALLDLPGWQATPVYRQHQDETPHWLEPAGWLPGAEACAALLQHPRIRCHWGSSVALKQEVAGPLIWCTAQAPEGAVLHATLRTIRGQQSRWAGQGAMLGEYTPRVGDVVAGRAGDDLLFGASYVYDDDGCELRPTEALRYGQNLPQPPQPADLPAMQHWAALRRQARDRLPLCGPMPGADTGALRELEAGRTTLQELPVTAGQWLNLAHGARGATTAPLAAALLADQLCGSPQALLQGEAAAIDPRRFLLRAWRRGELRL